MDYKLTRKEVENFVNNKVLPSIKAKYKSGSIISRVNMLALLYATSRMSALESLLRLVLIDITGKDDYKELEGYFNGN